MQIQWELEYGEKHEHRTIYRSGIVLDILNTLNAVHTVRKPLYDHAPRFNVCRGYRSLSIEGYKRAKDIVWTAIDRGAERDEILKELRTAGVLPTNYKRYIDRIYYEYAREDGVRRVHPHKVDPRTRADVRELITKVVESGGTNDDIHAAIEKAGWTGVYDKVYINYCACIARRSMHMFGEAIISRNKVYGTP